MKIGIQIVAYNCADKFEELISPWVKLKNKYDIKIWVGSGQFKIYHDMGCENMNGPTIELLKNMLDKGSIDCLFQPSPDNLLGDHTTRDKCVPWMKENDIDLMVQLDADEFYTDKEVENYLEFIKENPQYDTYNTVFKNMVGDGSQYENWARFSAAWIKRHGGISHYYFDAHWSFGGEDGNNIEYRNHRLKNKTIPRELCNPKHYTWTNNLNTAGPSHIKDKMAYQQKYYGGEGCGWKWDEEKQSVVVNDEYWEKNGWNKPQLKND